MWLTNSSVGRKLVMSITGLCLILFVTFHAVMNGVALFWPSAYNMVCAFLGANWYALIASIGLAALFIIHIIYALWLTVQNRKARGNDRYAVVRKPEQVEWSSQNMLILGIVVLAFLCVHMIQFWAKMQLAEILECPATCDGTPVPPQAGTLFIQMAFSQIWTPIVYIIGFVALWFHMTHGFWSMFQSAGWDNDTWLPRLKCIGNWWCTIVVGLFLAEAIVFTVQANNDAYLTNPVLLNQYEEFAMEQAHCNGAIAIESAEVAVVGCQEVDCAPCNTNCESNCTPCSTNCAPCNTNCESKCTPCSSDCNECQSEECQATNVNE